MVRKSTKDSLKPIIWTKHSEHKLSFYQISKQRVLRIIKNPYRIEQGIAPNTIAAMQPTKKKNWKQEIWVMYQKTNNKIKIISTWRYPGKSPIQNPIPKEIIEELKREGLLS